VAVKRGTANSKGGKKERRKERGRILKARQFNSEVAHMSIGEIGAHGKRVEYVDSN
jgi:hypothetical protein